jgi:hypothetical protein
LLQRKLQNQFQSRELLIKQHWLHTKQQLQHIARVQPLHTLRTRVRELQLKQHAMLHSQRQQLLTQNLQHALHIKAQLRQQSQFSMLHSQHVERSQLLQ